MLLEVQKKCYEFSIMPVVEISFISGFKIFTRVLSGLTLKVYYIATAVDISSEGADNILNRYLNMIKLRAR